MAAPPEPHWIESAGGPLVLLQASSANTWHGVIGADYDNACAVTGYTGVLRKERRDILVLGDEPMSTAHLTVAGEHFLVRWICGPDKQAVLDAGARMRGALGKVIEEVDLDIIEDTQLIIDSAAPAQSPPDQLDLSISPGKYRVLTFDYKPAPEIHLIVHHFRRD